MKHKTIKGYITCPVCLADVYYDNKNTTVLNNKLVVVCPNCMNDIKIK